MYGEHPNGGMTEIESHNVDFLEDKFPRIGEIKKDLELYELQQDLQPCLGEGEDLNSRQVLGKIQALKFINPKCKVHRCVLGVSSAGSCVLSTGIN